MQHLQALDAALFHLVNPALSCTSLDMVMPFFSGNPLFGPALLIAGILLLCKGGARGRIFVLMIALIVPLGDSFVCNTLKHVLHRPRPFLTLADVHMPTGIGKTDSGSMPSSHAANWFAAAMIAFIYFRHSIKFMLPLAALVGFSRIYNGVHYPSDVLAGAILGAGYAACGVYTLDALWRRVGLHWFPLWYRRLPSLLNPIVTPPPLEKADPALLDHQYMRLGYALIFIQLVVNLAYIASGIITLSEDEAYQWIWSKHPALSYYSKPPLIAIIQRTGTGIWGDNAFGVRFFAPVFGAITAFFMLRFLARAANVRAAFWLLLVLFAIPLISVGSTLMTIDPPSVMFWMLAVIAGWRAVQEDSTIGDWFWVGLWMGLGFLSKYTALFQLLSWALFFALYPPARRQMKRPGPYLALFINFICSIPVLIWNSRNDWITVKHVSQGAALDEHWTFTPANLWHHFSRHTTEFIGAEFALLNPFFFAVILVTAVIFWRQKTRPTLLVYLFSMCAPIFVCYFLWTFHSRVLPNWIAPAIPPMFCFAVVYWEAHWLSVEHWVKVCLKTCLVGGLIYGLFLAVVLRDTNIIAKFSGGYHLPPTLDSTRRVKGWVETAELVEAAREKLEAEGRPTFIIANHYGIAGEMTFYIPEAKAHLLDHPLVFSETTKVPMNQFYFWPGYTNRTGQNAIYIRELDLNNTNDTDVSVTMQAEFDSATNIGSVLAMHQGQPVHRVAIIECRGLR
jgi:4-amino-4-deoxy-L-arabinose transferase-like glycosyltransferase/membrane-associated phospholipid phosphatase